LKYNKYYIYKKKKKILSILKKKKNYKKKKKKKILSILKKKKHPLKLHLFIYLHLYKIIITC